MTNLLTRRDVLRAGAIAAPFAWRNQAIGQERDRFAALEVRSGGRIGVAGLDTGSGATVSHRADERFPLCSTFKLLAAAAILKRSATERGLLEQRVAYGADDLVAYSPVTSLHAGAGMTVAELCAAALQYSDNTAANQMIRLLGGPSEVTAFARSAGDRAFRLDRWETALNTAVPGDARDTSTPQSMMDDLRHATLGTLLDAPERAQLVNWMTGCMTGMKRIRAAAPAGSVVADKTGSGDNGTANDVAVIWPAGRAPLVLAIYTTAGQHASDDLVAAVAKAALEALGH